MTIVIQPQVISILMVSTVLIILMIFGNKKLTSFDPLEEPKGLVLLLLMAVETVDSMVYKDVNDEIGENLGPYVGTLWGYVFLSGIWGLTGFESPVGNYSVTLTLALITVVLVEVNSFKYNGAGSYLHGLFEPIFLFLPMNIIGKISPVISLSMRLFANTLAGSIIMSLLYYATSHFSSMIPLIGSFNIFGVLIAPILHIYFDLISALLQTFIFTSLTIIFIGKELPSTD